MSLAEYERAGSSPRVRGKRGRRSRPRMRARLIPACAGKTMPLPLRRRPDPAHPRVCGENLIDKPNILKGLGSSPRVRGKRRSRRSARAS